MTALVPSETACLASSPGKINRTAVWISRDVTVGFLLYRASLAASRGDLLEDVVDERVHDGHRLGGDAGVRVHLLQDLVDVDLVGFGLGLASNLLGARGLLLRGFLGHRVRAFASWNGARPGRATAHGDFSRNRLIVSGSRVHGSGLVEWSDSCFFSQSNHRILCNCTKQIHTVYARAKFSQSRMLTVLCQTRKRAKSYGNSVRRAALRFRKRVRVGARWRARVITRRACTRPFAYSHTHTQRTCARVDRFRARRVAVVAAARERALTARRRFARVAVSHENVWSR